MARIIVVYHSVTGNTEKMGSFIRRGIESEGAECGFKKAAETAPEELLEYEGVIVGSPTYYGCMAGEVKRLIDQSVAFHGKLQGKAGGAFSSSANLGGGNETTVLNILQALLVHGMVVQGDAKGAHYGPVSVGQPDENVKNSCIEYGKKYAGLAKKLAV